jgi:hypothetical protein
MKIILINGSARSGKDSLANAFAKFTHEIGLKSEVVKFAGPLKEMVHRAFGLPERHDSQEAVKDQRLPLLFGETPRNLYIGFSELLMKPLFGDAVFGQMLVNEIVTLEEVSKVDKEPGADFYLVSDSGFTPEAKAIVDHFGVYNVMLVRLHRPGYTFAGDSRGYIELPGVKTKDYDLGPNLSELEDVVARLFISAQGKKS